MPLLDVLPQGGAAAFGLTSVACVIGVIVVVLLVLLATSVRVVPEYQRLVVFRLGRVLGAKGPDFYLNSWPIYVKLALFLAVGLISVTPTLAFIRWRRALDHEAQWKVPEEERARMRRLIMIEVHLAALIPLIAVIMSRGLGT